MSILCHLRGNRVTETCNHMHHEEFALFSPCLGLSTREASNALSHILPNYFQEAALESWPDTWADSRVYESCQEFTNPDLSSFEVTSYLQHFYKECAYRAHCSVVILYLAFKHFHFTADTNCKSTAGGKFSNIKSPSDFFLLSLKRLFLQGKCFVKAKYLLLFRDSILLELTLFTCPSSSHLSGKFPKFCCGRIKDSS